MMLSTMTSPPVAVLDPPSSSPSILLHTPPRIQDLRMERFIRTTEERFVGALTPETLQILSATLQSHYNEACQSHKICMLPSFCHSLPTGQEEGIVLAVDVGGSTLRVGLVQLNGRNARSEPLTVLRSKYHVIDHAVRSLVGRAFFEWMADRIYETLEGDSRWLRDDKPLRIGLAWSFPTEQLSIRDGLLLPMGKDFHAIDGLLGENLADLVAAACEAKNLNVSVETIVNDSVSSLLSGAYESHSAAPIALILGTGLNATVDLSVSALSQEKFGDRPASWLAAARHVLVNTEMSLFGGKVFPLTRWDTELKRGHSKPDFQPLEHLTCGRYLGELVRLVLLDAIRLAGLFDGAVPANFDPYALTGETISVIEGDRSHSLSRAAAVLNAKHPLPANRPYRLSELAHIRHITELISSRAAAYLATSLHAMYEFKYQHEPASARKADIAIGCNGSMIEKYPEYMLRTQEWLDLLVPTSSKQGHVRLEMNGAGDSCLNGAAVAVACQGL